MADLREIIGQQIAKRRKELNLTQKELADKTDLTKDQISKIERCLSLPNAISLFKLSQVLRTSIDYFFHRIDFYNNNINNEKILLTIYHQLNQTQQQELIKYAQYLIEKNK